MDDGVLIGEVPSIEEVEWVTLGKEMRKDTLKTLNEDAKGLATLGSSLCWFTGFDIVQAS
ncbi:MAG: hypothetical protein AAGG66_00965 [Methanothrix soehngenii]|jgi:hypothetical protein|uniref:hypothetical protein n=1 Tax=Methanothrix soehngenii TaxID=2223 RepID=UPI003140E6A0